MTRKIFKSIFAVAAAVLLICLVLVIGVLYSHFTSIQENQLRAEMALAEQGIEGNGIEYLQQLKTPDDRITWIAEDGTVIYDTENDAEQMENHGQREEVKEALKSGSGESARYSTTLTEKTFYYAKLLDDGTVLRLSVSQATVVSLVYGMIQPILMVLIAALIISALIAGRLSKKIVNPLNNLDLDNPLENEAYDELSPLLLLIEKQHRQINTQLRELDRKQNEFLAVTGNMSEGLVLLSRDGKILSINNSAAEFFDASIECVGRDFITIERSQEIEKVIKTAVVDGHGELQLSRYGREYQLNVSKIRDKEKVAGVVLLIFDITDRVFAERNRREFTANVSHELKTPLQSIMGSAELIENGLVRSEDMPEFIGRIRSESARLVNLIDDIIHLSQLDENSELIFEDVDIREAVAQEIQALQVAAGDMDVTMSLEGEGAVIKAVPQLLHEIVHNLCENAIKYNVHGGSVKITAETHGDMAMISVKDTGIGIAQEHHERIFERFYRVDKSHSKETGGTGLGLSIVKHAVEYMKGELQIDSTQGEGTEIKVLLPVAR